MEKENVADEIIDYHITRKRCGCKICRYNFSKFTGTYLEHTRLPPNIIIHLLYFFTLDVPARLHI